MKDRIFILDDDPLIAMDLALMLEEAGYCVLGPCHSLSEAQETLGKVSPDAAILDVNLGNETSLPVAMQLKERGLPFIILSGYDQQSMPEELRGAPMLSKPFVEKEILRKISSLL